MNTAPSPRPIVVAFEDLIPECPSVTERELPMVKEPAAGLTPTRRPRRAARQLELVPRRPERRVLWKSSQGDSLTLEGQEEVYRTMGREYRRPVLPDGTVWLSEGPDGLLRKERPGVLRESDNAMLFTCKHCHRLTRVTMATIRVSAHEPGCGHSFAGAVFRG